MSKKGHSVFRLGHRNVMILYRHSIWMAPDLIEYQGIDRTVSVEPLDLDGIPFQPDFDLKQIKRDILAYPDLVWGLMARVDHQIVGFCVIYLKGSKTTQYRIGKCDAYLDCVCVDKKFRGYGIAPILMADAVKQVREKEGNEILLAVRRDNENMIHAIKKLGFHFVKHSLSVRFLGMRILYPIL